MNKNFLITKLTVVVDQSKGDLGRNQYILKRIKHNKDLINSNKLYLEQILGLKIPEITDETHSPPYALENSTLYYFPASTQTATLNLETNVWDAIDNEVTYAVANNFLKEHGFAVIIMHPYEFAETNFGVYTGNVNLQAMDNLGKLIEQFRDNGIDVVSIGQITEKRISDDENQEFYSIDGITNDKGLLEIEFFVPEFTIGVFTVTINAENENSKTSKILQIFSSSEPSHDTSP